MPTLLCVALTIMLISAIMDVVVWKCHQLNESLASVHAYCDAEETFQEWRLQNEGVYIGLSEEGQRLVGHLLESYDWFMQTHKYTDGSGRRDRILSLLDDFPPNSPDEVPEADPRSVRMDAPFK